MRRPAHIAELCVGALTVVWRLADTRRSAPARAVVVLIKIRTRNRDTFPDIPIERLELLRLARIRASQLD